MILRQKFFALAGAVLLAAVIAACAQTTEPAQTAEPTVAKDTAPDIAAIRDVIASTAAAHGLEARDYVPLADETTDTPNLAAIYEAASNLARDLKFGAAPASARIRWHIADDPIFGEYPTRTAATTPEDIARFLDDAAPSHPQYGALEAQLAVTPETDNGARRILKINMERWRWLPGDLGTDYVLVNVPAFEAMIVRDDAVAARHRIIVGETKTPTPQFKALTTGVIANPTWFVPASIVRESVGALMQNNPKRAAQLGYYKTESGSIRQRPGPANALGEMKLDMPNPYSVFMHDTPAKVRFDDAMRALSHGCIRVDKAGDFARALLQADDKKAAYDAAIAGRKNTVIEFDDPIPVYIVYFTAAVDADGTLTFYPDIYSLDENLIASPTADFSDQEADNEGCIGDDDSVEEIDL